MKLKPGDILVAKHGGPWRKVRILDRNEGEVLDVDYSYAPKVSDQRPAPFRIHYGALDYSNQMHDWFLLSESDIVTTMLNLYS